MHEIAIRSTYKCMIGKLSPNTGTIPNLSPSPNCNLILTPDPNHKLIVILFAITYLPSLICERKEICKNLSI